MKELFKSSPLILFLGLLLVLSISIYFGNKTTISEGLTSKDAAYQMTPAEIKCYNNRYPDLNKAFNSDAQQLQQHWTNHGAKEGRNNSCTPTEKDPDYQMSPAEIKCYNNRYPDLNKAFNSDAQQLQQHWTNHGAYERRNNSCTPTPKDPDYQMSPAEIICYNNRYPDLNNAFKSNAQQLQQHWTNNGAYEGRNNQCVPTSKDAAYQMSQAELECYNNRYPDLKALNWNGQQLQDHWTNHGAKEGRYNQCTPTPKDAAYQMCPAEIECYNNRYPDLKALNWNAQQLQHHWTNHGAKEGRNNQCEPTSAPTTAPTSAPTTAPTSAPTTAPTSAPTTTPNNLSEAKLLAKILGKYTAKQKRSKKYDDDYDDYDDDEINYKRGRTRQRYYNDEKPPSFSPGQQPNVLLFPEKPKDTNPVSDYYNWLSFWNTVANSTDPNAMFQSSNYISKTAVVPPVCPNCPQSHDSSSGVCNSCGGQGGSGTSSKNKNKFADFLALYGKDYRGNGKWVNDPTDSSGNGGNLSRLAESAGSGAVDLTKTVLKESTGLARDTGSGAVGLLKDTGSGAVGLLRDTGSGVKDLIEDTGSGVAGLLKSNPAQISNQPNNNQNQGQGQGGSASGQPNSPYQSGYYSQGTYNLPSNPLGVQGIDPYSYNGALVPKGSNYIPVTSDFSSFRR